MSIFISGSVAYDTVLSFEGAFADHLLADNLHELNVTFQTPRMIKNFGGCAGNIAYGLRMLGATPFIASAWGQDAHDYEKHFESLGISTRGILRIPDHFTAQALITTDRLGNQLTAFHEGAMAFAAKAHADGETLELGVITPMDTPVMRAHVNYLNARKVRIVLDIGQASAYLTGEDMRWLIERVDILTMSHYEWQVLLQKTQWSKKEILGKVQALIVTQAEKGATLTLSDGFELHLNALPVSDFKSPVGCGDAFRSGLVAGLSMNLGWEKSMRLATLMGAIKAEVQTPQGYRFTLEEIEMRYAQAWGEKLSLSH
ncbi:MAG: carbohydrate kinase family protein [Burkholderiaceae bacterium]|nr:carbohydrate kinase family protein [Burkholderiaceae bacterium]